MRAMTVSPNTLPLIGSAAPEPQPAPKTPAPGGGTKSFSNLLRQSRPAQTRAPAVQAPRPDAALRSHDDATADESPSTAPRPSPRSADKTAGPGPRPSEPARPASSKAQVDADHGADAAADAATKESAPARTDGHPGAADASLAQFLAHLHPPPVPAGAGIDGSPIDAAAATDAAAVLSGTATSDAAASGSARAARADREEPAADAVDAAAGRVPLGVDAAAAITTMAAERRRPEPSSTVPSIESVAGSGALSGVGAAPVPSAGGAATDAVPVALATPVDSPDFPHVLGVQISVLAEGGVQHAELHLNPADMGPVSVQITMDGTAARVDFGVDVAATRQAIEAGLPELAGALRDAGFTLTGGGVSEHSSGGRQGGEHGRGGAGGNPAAGANAEPASPSRRTVALGGLDLYA